MNLDAAEHRRLLVDGPDGLELAAFQVGDSGRAVSVGMEGDVRGGHRRCAAAAAMVRGHAPLLRHTFTVVMQLQLAPYSSYRDRTLAWRQPEVSSVGIS